MAEMVAVATTTTSVPRSVVDTTPKPCLPTRADTKAGRRRGGCPAFFRPGTSRQVTSLGRIDRRTRVGPVVGETPGLGSVSGWAFVSQRDAPLTREVFRGGPRCDSACGAAIRTQALEPKTSARTIHGLAVGMCAFCAKTPSPVGCLR